MGIVQLNSQNLDRVAKKEKGVYVIKFSSKTCGPCQAMKPVFDVFDQENPQLNIYEVDVDQSYELAAHFGVRSVPTTLFCEGREILYQFTGATPKGDLEYVYKNINDSHFRETGEFKVEKKSDYGLWLGVGAAVLFLAVGFGLAFMNS